MIWQLILSRRYNIYFKNSLKFVASAQPLDTFCCDYINPNMRLYWIWFKRNNICKHVRTWMRPSAQVFFLTFRKLQWDAIKYSLHLATVKGKKKTNSIIWGWWVNPRLGVILGWPVRFQPTLNANDSPASFILLLFVYLLLISPMQTKPTCCAKNKTKPSNRSYVQKCWSEIFWVNT